MPITQERFLSLLQAGEDQAQGLRQACEIAAREARLVAEGKTSAEEALANISLFLTPEGLLQQPVASQLTLQAERKFFSKERLGINRRSKDRQARKRGRQPPAGEPDWPEEFEASPIPSPSEDLEEQHVSLGDFETTEEGEN